MCALLSVFSHKLRRGNNEIVAGTVAIALRDAGGPAIFQRIHARTRIGSVRG